MVAKDQTARAIAFAFLTYFLFSCMDALAKWLGEGYPVVQLVFFRSLFGLLPLIPVVVREGGLRSLHTRRPWLHLARGVLVLVALATFFFGLQLMPLAEALTLAFTSPLFLTILSVPMLGEKVGPHRWGAVLVGFGGVLVIVRPGVATFQPEALLPLTSGFTFALSSIVTRMLGRTETNGSIALYSTLAQGLPAAALLPFFWVAPAGWFDWVLFLGLGVLGGIALQIMTLAFRHAPASVLAPFEYTSLLWATIFGWFFWREWPGDHVWAGAAILVASGLYITYRETRRRKPARRTIG